MSEELAKGLYNACVPIGGGIGALTSFFLLKNLSRK
jgi:5,10-methylene-tetrahydrofolate dehydrogenase/methenyl tetrahydrofolate cyclohydrolase